MIVLYASFFTVHFSTAHFGWQLSYLPPSRINWLSLYHSISVLGLESSAVHANSMKFPAITGVGGLNVIAFGGTVN